MGCAALHYLARLGVSDTLLLERDTLASGSTGRSMTILRMHYSNEVTTQMAWWSRDIIAKLDRHTGHPSGFVQNGWLMLPGEGNEDAAQINVEMAQRLGVETEIIEATDAQERWPYVSFEGSRAAVWEPLSGYADSHLVTTGFANSARSSGAQLRLGVKVTGFRTDANAITAVETDEGYIYADKFILTAGPWNSDLLEILDADLPLHTVRHQVIRLIHQPEFSASADPLHPTIAHIPTALSVRPDMPGTALIGYREDPVHRDSYNQGVDSAVVAEGMAALQKIVPAYADAGWDGGWSGLFTVTPDWNPVIDRVPRWANAVVGAGFSGHGFKLSPAIGLSLAELSTGARDTKFDLQPLRFSRFQAGDLLKSAYGGNVFA